MNRRIVSLMIAGAIIIMILLIGSAVLSVILKGSAAVPTLPSMPTYDFAFSTSIPPITATPSATSFPETPLPSTNTLPPGTSTQTPLPLFILNGTPVFPTARPASNNVARISSPTSLSANIWTYTPTRTAAAAIPTSTKTVTPVQTCRNVLIPVVTGQQWRYQADALGRSESLNMSVLSVNNSQGNIQVNDLTTGGSKQVQVQCDGDVLRGFPSISVDAIFGNTLDSNMTASYLSGVLAPNEAAFLNNNWALSWSTQYLVSGTTVLDRNGTQISLTINNAPVTVSCQTLAAGDAAFETIAVGAGTFRALKVVCTETGQVTAVVNGITVSGLAEGRSNQWFAPKIGLVKMQVIAVSLRVFDLPFSILTDNSLELKSFIPVP